MINLTNNQDLLYKNKNILNNSLNMFIYFLEEPSIFILEIHDYPVESSSKWNKKLK